MTRARSALIGIGVLALGAVAARQALPPAPVPQVFDHVRGTYCPSDTRLLDRRGAVLHELRVDPARRRLAWTPLAAVSPALSAALLASEDRRFETHRGVDWHAAAAAIWQCLRGGPPRGASTITMQVAALLDPTLGHRAGPRSLAEKWRQMRAAWALERAWTKQQILEAYLNLVTFRGELQGIAAASQVLFGKAPHGLTNAESLVLAALVRSPNADRESLTRRAANLECVLRSRGPCGRPPARPDTNATQPLLSTGADGASEAADAAVDRALALPRGGGPRIALAPHAARRLLPQTAAAPCADTASTLDLATQRTAAAALRRHLLAIRDRSARDAALLVTDNASGEVLAYVASSGDLSPASQVDGIQARRQAGSTLKPFLYARALDRRLLTAASLLDDAPLEITAGNGVFRPRNYDERFRGLVSLRTALAGSLNVPAVRALLLLGPDDFAAQLRGLGFTGIAEPGEYYGPSLALGSADVTLWQLVNAYRTLANGGVWSPLLMHPANVAAASAPASVAPRDCPAAGDCSGRGARLYSSEAAFIVSDVLADRDSRSVTFGLESPLATRFWSAVKTGTSKDMRDNWCVGFSRRYTVGVWVGNFSGEPMRDVSGVTGAAPIWADLMSWLHRDLPSHPPRPPPGVVQAAAGFVDAVEPPRREWFLAGTEPPHGDVVRARVPRIVAPADGSIIAIDPDIPPARQRVAFEAESADAELRWVLDDADLGCAARPLLWHPAAGRHRLALVDAHAHTLGSVSFEVRGGAAARRPAT